MAIVQIKGFVHAERRHTGEFRFLIRDVDMSGYDGFGHLVGEATFDYEVPADFNPVAAELAGLNKQLEEVNREFAAKVRRINEQIAKLEAIEYTPEAKS
jgi:hypothetical protein